MIDSTAWDGFRFNKTTLKNGLDVIVGHQPRLPLVAINLWYHVGSKNEERTQRGFTHLFEHLMFEGSEHYRGDFFKHLQRLGANINGSTSSDRTNYFVDLPTAHAELAMAMESDRMANLLGALDVEKLRIQKGVVKNEYRQNYANRPYGMVLPLLAEALFPAQHPYSWVTIGAMEDLERATMEDVSSFFRRFYVPSNASLAVVGDLDESRAIELAERYFGPIPGGTPALRPWAPEPTLAEGREILLHDRVELDRLYLVWPTVPHFHGDDAALILLGDVLARGKSSRLYRKLVIEHQVAQDVSAHQSGRELAGSFGIVVTLRPSRSIGEARNLIESELSALASSEVQEDELRRVQILRVAAFFFAMEHMGGFGGIADRLNAYNVFRGDPALIATDVQRFRAVGAGELRSVALRYLADRPRVTLSVIGRKDAARGVPLDRSVIPTRSEPAGYRAPLPRILILRCGLPLWVFRRSDLPTVAGSIVVTGGASAQQPSRPEVTQLTADMLEEGTTSRTAAQIAQLAEERGATIAASCGWDGTYVGFKCLSDDLVATLDLAADILINPTFPEAEWQRVQGQTLAALQAERDSAESRAYRALLLALYGPEHPYRHPLAGTEASVRGITTDHLRSFHSSCLVPSQAAVVVAGDVDPDALADELDRRLGEWRGPALTLPPIPSAAHPAHPRLLVLDRPGAPQAVVRVGHRGLARLDPDFDTILVFNQILGGQFTSRLNAKLREERGFTYGVRSHFECRRGAGPFSIGTAVQSDRLVEALDDIRLELAAIVTGRPPTQDELDDARRALVQGQPRHFETPAALVNRYANLLVHGLPADHEAGFSERLQRIDRDSLIAAARAQIHPDAMVVVVVADAAQVLEDLKRLEWAQAELIQE
jgi:predicted Zn-dependent peptidase